VNREPIFNIPPVVLAVLAVLALVHLARSIAVDRAAGHRISADICFHSGPL
jgi:hypothetical protein